MSKKVYKFKLENTRLGFREGKKVKPISSNEELNKLPKESLERLEKQGIIVLVEETKTEVKKETKEKTKKIE